MRFTLADVSSFRFDGASLLSVGTISTSELAAKSLRVDGTITFCSAALSIAFWSADANTSAGAPFTICCISTSDAPKLNSSLVPGCSFSYASPTALNALVRLAAADTTSSSARACAAKANENALATSRAGFRKRIIDGRDMGRWRRVDRKQVENAIVIYVGLQRSAY